MKYSVVIFDTTVYLGTDITVQGTEIISDLKS